MSGVKALPYKNLAGVVPCPGGWLVLPARLAGITVVAEDAFVLRTLVEVLDYRPKFDAAAIDAPMGFNDHPVGAYRTCDDEARELVGWPRRVGIRPVPSRAALFAPSREKALELEPWLTRDDFRRFRWLREAAQELQPFHQRMFFSANPDLSFQVMNGDEPLATSPFHEDGQLERLELIRQRLPGIDDVVTRVPPPGAGVVHMFRAAALLWTARRGSGRAINRLPLDPTWDPNGMRMELVR
jgi:predicted RNase H-like nuclease